MLESLICFVTRLQGRGARFNPARRDVTDNNGVRMTVNGYDIIAYRDYVVNGKALTEYFRLLVRVNVLALSATLLLKSQ